MKKVCKHDDTEGNKWLFYTVVSGLGPYWNELSGQFEEIFDLFKVAITVISTEGPKWVKETAKESAIEYLTKGKITMVTVEF